MRRIARRIKYFLQRIFVGLQRFVILDLSVRMAHFLQGMEGVNGILQKCPANCIDGVLARFGAQIGPECDLNTPLLIHNALTGYSNFTVGRECHLGKDVFLDLLDQITLEDQVTVSMRTTILTHVDVGHSPLGRAVLPSRHAPVLIKRGAYIGAGATILEGIVIGECAMIQAGAIVTRDIPPYCLAGGVPARVKRYVSMEDTGVSAEIQDVHSPTSREVNISETRQMVDLETNHAK